MEKPVIAPALSLRWPEAVSVGVVVGDPLVVGFPVVTAFDTVARAEVGVKFMLV